MEILENCCVGTGEVSMIGNRAWFHRYKAYLREVVVVGQQMVLKVSLPMPMHYFPSLHHLPQSVASAEKGLYSDAASPVMSLVYIPLVDQLSASLVAPSSPSVLRFYVSPILPPPMH